MRLRTIASRTGMAALAAGIAAAGALVLPAPASAADNVTATLRVTLTRGDSMYTIINGIYNCTRNFTVGQAKDVTVTVPRNRNFWVFPSRSCYDVANPLATVVAGTDGQVVNLTL